MEDRSVANVGVVLAGFALTAAALPWGTPGVGPVENVALAVLAGVALGAFSLRRHGLLARRSGSLAAGIASLGVVSYTGIATAGTLAGGSGSMSSVWGPTLALVGGLGGVIAAYGDGRGLPESLGQAVKATGWSLAVGFAGLFAIAVWSSVLISVLSGLLPGNPGTASQLAVGALGLGLGTGSIALIYFQWTEKTAAYLDFRVPTKRDVGYIVGGVVAIFGLQMLISVVFSQLGVQTASHSVQQAASGGNAEVLLLMIPASWLIIGPGEELLYRNIIQKELYGTFGGWGAVLVGSFVFSLAHIPAYAAGATTVAALVSTLGVILSLSLVLGTTYHLTTNTTVAALVHGTYDAVVFGAMYVQMAGMA
ncbi:CPBP family intramembrane glutamic endopeptidase [Halorussus lipolyticus]|uniref:CPBP family intramembrane glutamic endopeptidase n=1 Tax=Halorussus lipolyticus TaxID=3034024 RepID=UPI0023E83295|nr:CPBP family intramembrane glutamic endopeptidase [Halorussus sp. DT80]